MTAQLVSIVFPIFSLLVSLIVALISGQLKAILTHTQYQLDQNSKAVAKLEGKVDSLEHELQAQRIQSEKLAGLIERFSDRLDSYRTRAISHHPE